MKRFMVGAVAMVVMIAAVAWAQQGPGSGGRGMRGRGELMYDPSKVETVSGEVAAVKEFTSRRGLDTGVGLTLNTGSGTTMTVHLGPRFYLDLQPVKFAVGDKVEITGVKSVRRGQEVFIAGEVKKGGEVLKLRDENGRPLWAGTGPRAGKQTQKAPVGC